MGGTEVDHRGVRVRVNGRVWKLEGGESFTFGRSPGCDFQLPHDDSAVSRRAGLVERDGELWMLVNQSRTRSLTVVAPSGLPTVLLPGNRVPVEGRMRVIAEGAAKYELVLTGPERERAFAVSTPPEEETGQSTSVGDKVLINEADRKALVALFAGYLLEGPKYDPNPRSYAAAASRLGWPRTTLVKRVEYIRTRLADAGVPGVQGPYALSGLAEYALTTGLITRDDLRLIGLASSGGALSD